MKPDGLLRKQNLTVHQFSSQTFSNRLSNSPKFPDSQPKSPRLKISPSKPRKSSQIYNYTYRPLISIVGPLGGQIRGILIQPSITHAHTPSKTTLKPSNPLRSDPKNFPARFLNFDSGRKRADRVCGGEPAGRKSGRGDLGGGKNNKWGIFAKRKGGAQQWAKHSRLLLRVP